MLDNNLLFTAYRLQFTQLAKVSVMHHLVN